MWTDEEVLSLCDNSPEPLFDSSMRYLVNNLDIITTQDQHSGWRKLRDNITLPSEICERFLEDYQKKYRVNDNVANIFRDRIRTRLTLVKLRHATITDEGLRCLLQHKPVQVELDYCESLSHRAIDVICENNEKLVSLRIGPLTFTPPPSNSSASFYHKFRQEAHKLRRVAIQCSGMLTMPLMLLKPLKNLTHLDLSDYSSSGTYSLCELKNLRSLILHNVNCSKDIINWICMLHNLRHLDLSHSNDTQGKYLHPNEILLKVMKNLPHLISLDISGTNLAGNGSAAVPIVNDGEPDVVELQARCDIPGLVTRVNNPLEFLGLYGTHHEACKRFDIPAKLISGDANEEQILTAARAYLERPAMLTRVLNDLNYLFRNNNIQYVERALNVVLRAMEKYLSEKHIQISGSASLYYIIKGKDKARIGMKLKRRIITVLLDGMYAHIEDVTMMKECCLTLCQFSIPGDVLYEYERVVEILLKVTEATEEWIVLRIAMYILNSLAWQVDGKQKLFLGNRGAVAKMLNVISKRLKRRLCDEVMEVAWSTMWNVTNETPQNCECFLDNRGMECFLSCLRSFPEEEELLRNMMGPLGNVAEVPHLRPRFMDSDVLSVFYDLLNSTSDGIEVSFNAARVLVHIASDGPDAWTVAQPSRPAVLQRVAAAVYRWDQGAERNIYYRSFQPILTMLRVHHTPMCQHWAVWALLNLTTVYPEKYCNMVVKEGGLPLLRELLNRPRAYPPIKRMALVVLDIVSRYCSRDDPSESASDN